MQYDELPAAVQSDYRVSKVSYGFLSEIEIE